MCDDRRNGATMCCRTSVRHIHLCSPRRTVECTCYSGAACRFSFRRLLLAIVFFFSSRRRHTRLVSDWSSDVCSSDLRTGSLNVKCSGGDFLRESSGERVLATTQLRPERGARWNLRKSSSPSLISSGEIGRASCRERV